mmetsp:Transcript_33579/g.48954  ORF Transcript_33579/g.48954 Transcript_33579/m.48954 type:complete len:107 (+) Transcript_33579:3903-4223(+)
MSDSLGGKMSSVPMMHATMVKMFDGVLKFFHPHSIRTFNASSKLSTASPSDRRRKPWLAPPSSVRNAIASKSSPLVTLSSPMRDGGQRPLVRTLIRRVAAGEDPDW